jgi:small subunit ribosomal protein S21
MLIINVKGKNGIERALKEYKNKVYKTKLHQEIRERKEYTKNSVEKREKKKKAIYVNKKKNGL